MNKIETNIPEVVILEPRVYGDDRGWFSESWNVKTLRDLNIKVRFVQDNESFSRYGVLRGLHFQKGDAAQAKLVRVVAGEVLDVAVDIRVGSPTFGQHVAVRLSADITVSSLSPRDLRMGLWCFPIQRILRTSATPFTHLKQKGA